MEVLLVVVLGVILGVSGSTIAKRWLEVGRGGLEVVGNEMAAGDWGSRATDTTARSIAGAWGCIRRRFELGLGDVVDLRMTILMVVLGGRKVGRRW